MSEQRNKILKLLEEGHLTADEAEKLLDALDNKQGNGDQDHSKQKHTSSNNHQNDSTDKNSFQDTVKKDFKSFTDGLLNFIDDTIQRVKEGPFEFSFNHVNVKRKFEFASDEVNHLNFDLTNSSVEFLPTQDQTITIQCNGKVYKEDDQDAAEKTFESSLSVGVTNDTLHIDQEEKNVSAELIIHMPKKLYEQAYIKTVNGSVKSRSVRLNVARISTVNGSVRLGDYDGDMLYVEAKHGSIRLDDVKVSKAKLETTTGSIYYDGEVDYLDADVTTGSVRTYLYNTDAQRVDLKTTTGSTQLYLPKNIKVKGNANTNVGSIDVNLPDVVVNKMDQHMVKKMVHFYNVADHESNLDVDVETKTGSIRIYSLS